MDARIVQAAFHASRPQHGKPVYDLVDLGDQGFAVLALKGVHDVSGKSEGELREQAKSLLMPRRTTDYYADYQAGLRQKAKIKIYSDQL